MDEQAKNNARAKVEEGRAKAKQERLETLSKKLNAGKSFLDAPPEETESMLAERKAFFTAFAAEAIDALDKKVAVMRAMIHNDETARLSNTINEELDSFVETDKISRETLRRIATGMRRIADAEAQRFHDLLARADVQASLKQLDAIMPYSRMISDELSTDDPIWKYPMHILTSSISAYIDSQNLQDADADTIEAQRKPFITFVKAYIAECKVIEKTDPQALYSPSVHGQIMTALAEKGLVRAVNSDEVIAATEKAETLEGYLCLSSSAIDQFIKQTLNSPGNVSFAKKGAVSVQPNLLSQDISITYRGSGTTATIELARTKELFKSRVRNGAKMYNFFLQKSNEQGGRETTTFLLQELVDNGLYSSKDSAYKGLKKIADKMMSMHIEGTQTEYGKGKPKEIRYQKAVLLSQFGISYNTCTVVLPPLIRHNVKYITILPTWAYALSEPGFMLLDYVYYLARQNAKRITEEGSFKISLEAIRAHLGLPTPERAGTDPKRLVIDPIEKAIEDIENSRKGTDIYITPVYNYDYKNVHEYLGGHLEIKLDEKATAYMGKIAGLQSKRRAETSKRIEKAKLKAQIKLEQEKIKQLQETAK